MSPSRPCLLLYYLIAHVGAHHNAPASPSNHEEASRHHDQPHLNSLLKARNLVSIEQLDEATPPPSKIHPPHIGSRDNTAGFINPELGTFINNLTNHGLSSRLDAKGLAAIIKKQQLKPPRNPNSASVAGEESDAIADPINTASSATASSVKSPSHAVGPEPPVTGLAEASNPEPPAKKSAAALYNEEVEKLIKQAKESHIPLVEGYNYTIPDPGSVGNGAELPGLFEIVGHNLGNSMGSTAGNLFGGTTNLLANYADAMKDSFVAVFGNVLPPLSEPQESVRRLEETTPAEDDTNMDDVLDGSSSTADAAEDANKLDGDLHLPGRASPHYEDMPMAGYPYYQPPMPPYWYMNPYMANPMVNPPYNVPPYMNKGFYAPHRAPFAEPSSRAEWAVFKAPAHMKPLEMLPTSHDPTPAGLIRNRWPGMGTNVGESLGTSVGNSLGNSLASDLNLIHGVANSAAENFFSVFNNGITGRPAGGVPPRGVVEPPSVAPARRLNALQNTNSPFAAFQSNSQDPLGLNKLLPAASSFSLPTLPPLNLDGFQGLLGSQSPLELFQQQLNALTKPNVGGLGGGLLGSSGGGLGSLPGLSNNGLGSSGGLTSGLGGIGSSTSGLGSSAGSLPNVPPAKSATQLWNEAVEKLQQNVQQLGLPQLDRYNASLPEIDTVGNGAGLPELTNQLGSNVGNSVGATLGNTVSGSASLVGSTASSIKDSLLASMTPTLTNFMSMFGGPAESGGKGARRLEASESEMDSVSCVEKDVAYTSTEASVLNNIYSLQECQRICQTYSTPLLVSGCSSVKNILPANKSACVGVSFTQVSGKCSLFFSVNGDYTVDGIDSAPVVCPSSTFMQPVSEFLTLVQSNEAAACLVKAGVTIIPIDDDVRPPLAPAPKVNISETLPPFINKEAEANDIWKYNPDTPMNLAENIEHDVVYQVQQTSGDRPMGKNAWGAKSDIKDWRYCALLCRQDADCAFWTYHFDPELYNQYGGSCSLATNKEPQGKAVGSTQTIAGPRLTVYPETLFGSLSPSSEKSGIRRLVADMVTRTWAPGRVSPPAHGENEAYLPGMIDPSLVDGGSVTSRRLAASGGKSESCQEFGLVYYSPFDSRTTGAKTLGVENVGNFTECEAHCLGAEGCVAYQYVPDALLKASERLQNGQAKNCLLLSAVDRKVAGDATIISGIVPPPNEKGCSAAAKPSMSPVKTNSWVVKKDSMEGQSENDTAEVSENDEDEDDGVETDEKAPDVDGLKDGVSLHGTLLSNTTNVFRVKSASECDKKCNEIEDCAAFSWGRWGGCYLFSDYTKEIADVDVVSKAKVGELDFEHDVEAGNGERSVFRCDRSKRGLVYTEASVLANLTDVKSSDQCFQKCRRTNDCYYMTFIDLDGVKEFAARSLYSVESGRRLATEDNTPSSLCLLLSAVKESKLVQPRLAISAETNCDVEGDLDFGAGTWLEETFSKIQYPAVITAATLGGIAVVAGGASMITRRRIRRKRRKANVATLDASPVTDMSKTPSGTNGLKNRNAFGMTSPLAASPGSVVDRMERGSPTVHVDDFESVEPKSTGKRLKRTFQVYVNN